jgi:hypothetical protein
MTELCVNCHVFVETVFGGITGQAEHSVYCEGHHE